MFIGVRVGAHVNLRFVLSGQPCAAMGRPRYQYPNFFVSTVDGAEFRSSVSGWPFAAVSSPLEGNPKFSASKVEGPIGRCGVSSLVILQFAGGTIDVDSALHRLCF